MVGAAGAERRELRELLRADEVEHRRLVVEMTDLAFGRRDHAADRRHQLCRDRPTLLNGQGLYRLPAKGGFALRLGLEPFDGAVDDADRRLVALPGRIAPGEQPVALQHDPARVWVLLAEL